MANTATSRLLAQFGLALGIPELQCQPDGACHLLIDNRHLVQIVYHPRDYILMSCPLITQESGAQLQETLLRANHGQAAGGIVLSCGPDGKFHAQLALPIAQTDPRQMLDQLETLLTEVERWDT